MGGLARRDSVGGAWATGLHETEGMTPSSCSCHAGEGEVLLARELIRIRATYRYMNRIVLDAALAMFRVYLDTEIADPLTLRYRISGASTLVLEITVPMFTDHEYVSRWCGLLDRTAIASSFDISPFTLGAA